MWFVGELGNFCNLLCGNTGLVAGREGLGHLIAVTVFDGSS